MQQCFTHKNADECTQAGRGQLAVFTGGGKSVNGGGVSRQCCLQVCRCRCPSCTSPAAALQLVQLLLQCAQLQVLSEELYTQQEHGARKDQQRMHHILPAQEAPRCWLAVDFDFGVRQLP